MPRAARIKSSDSIYHVMVRSVGDTILFKEEGDKIKYLALIQKYKILLNFKIYAYCLMSNHGHMIIDGNGADISKIMHSINQCYAQYFNRKYHRNGHVFQDRFKSKIVSDDRYFIALSGYIHNNPKDIVGYENSVEFYKYSSLGVYLGVVEENIEILDKDFLSSIIDIKEENNMKEYLQSVYESTNEALKDSTEFKDEKSQYRSERRILVRNHTPESVLEFVSAKTGITKNTISAKYSRKCVESKALCVFLMRNLCDYSYKTICSVLGNLSQTRMSKLASMGLDTVYNSGKYKTLVEEFLAC